MTMMTIWRFTSPTLTQNLFLAMKCDWIEIRESACHEDAARHSRKAAAERTPQGTAQVRSTVGATCNTGL
jgi:hypothetical protein